MTVKELIQKLMEIEDKDLPVAHYVYESSDGPEALQMYSEVSIQSARVYDYNKSVKNRFTTVKYVTLNLGEFWESKND